MTNKSCEHDRGDHWAKTDDDLVAFKNYCPDCPFCPKAEHEKLPNMDSLKKAIKLLNDNPVPEDGRKILPSVAEHEEKPSAEQIAKQIVKKYFKRLQYGAFPNDEMAEIEITEALTQARKDALEEAIVCCGEQVEMFMKSGMKAQINGVRAVENRIKAIRQAKEKV